MSLPTVIVPGYFARSNEYCALQQLLTARGFPTTTVPLKLRDWLPTVGGRSMIPILRRIEDTVQAMREQYQSPINVIGHSAGGWIARIYLGDIPYTIHNDVAQTQGVWNAHAHVATLVTLGTPHVSQERWTKRNLDFVKDNYPGAFYPHIRYVCVAGKAVYGKRFQSWLAYNSYQLTIGEGNSWGDGITPIAAAHLAGATNLTLEGVWHSPKSPGMWYGSPEATQEWVSYLL
ncbi:MAG: esterase/lipase family protein [Cyanophyceae cyanobacterium]